jgi:hypothetical protein
MLFSNKLMIIMSKENVNAEEAAISDTGKDIKKGMDRYEARIKSAAEGKHRQQSTLLGLKNKLDSN